MQFAGAARRRDGPAGARADGPQETTNPGNRRPGHPAKVFVGGVPQDITQDDLYNVFNEWGGVVKAWLQSYRTVARTNQGPPHNHRGFGFVIFSDASSVDSLIGSGNSRFISLPDGRRLEVKRAVPSSDLPARTGPTGSSVQPRGGGGGVRGGISASPLSAAMIARDSAAAMMVGMAPPLPMPAAHGLPMQAAYAAAPHAVHPWPTQMGFPATLPTSQPQAQAHSMIMTSVPYPGHYGAYPQPLPVQGVPQQMMAQHRQPETVHAAALQAGFPMMQSMQAVAAQHGHYQQRPM